MVALASSRDVTTLNSRVMKIENTFIEGRAMTARENIFMNIFLVFRASANLWNK